MSAPGLATVGGILLVLVVVGCVMGLPPAALVIGAVSGCWLGSAIGNRDRGT